MTTLRVGAAYPDPPFNGMPDDGGLDIDLMTAVGDKLGMAVDFIAYEGTDFNGIFDALNAEQQKVYGAVEDLLAEPPPLTDRKSVV